jgi:hypothetical protein
MNILLKFLEDGGEKPYRKLVEYDLRRTPNIEHIMLAVSGEWKMQPEKISKEKQLEFIDTCNKEFDHDASFWSKESCRSAFGKIMLIAVPELDLQDWIIDPENFWVNFEVGEVDTKYIKEEKQEASFGLFHIVTQNFTYSAYQNKNIRKFMGIRKSFFSR